MKGKAKNVSAGVAPQDKKKVGPVDPKGAYTKVQQRTLGKMKMGGTLSPVKGNVSKNVSNLNKAKSGASVKKAQMGATVTSAPVMMKKGGSMKKCKYGCK